MRQFAVADESLPKFCVLEIRRPLLGEDRTSGARLVELTSASLAARIPGLADRLPSSLEEQFRGKRHEHPGPVRSKCGKAAAAALPRHACKSAN